MARKVSIEILGDSASAERAFARTSRAARGFNHDVTSASKGAIAATIGFRGLGRSLAFASTSFLGGVGFAAAAKAAVNAATQIQEEMEKTGVVFGKNAKQVQAWAGTLAQSFGVGEGSALKAAGTFGNMFRSLHLGEPEAAKMSERLVTLAADMASFNNVSPADTLAALQSGLAGQVRPLRQFGVFLSQDRLKAEAYADGIAKAGSKLNATQKVQAAYNIILKDTSIQQGDVARNTGSLSVAQSKLRAQLEDSEAIIGKALLPSLVNLSNEFAVYLDKLNKSGTLQKDAAKAAEDISRGLHDAATAAGVVKQSFDVLDRVTGSFENTLKALATVWLVLKVRSKALDYEFSRMVAGEAAVGSAATVAAAEVGGLEGSLTRLKNIGPVPVAIALSFIPAADSSKNPNAFSNNPAAKGFAHLPVVGPLFSQANRLSDFLNNALGITPGAPSALPGVTATGNSAFETRGSPQRASALAAEAAAAAAVAKKIAAEAKQSTSLLGKFNILQLHLADAERTNNTILQRSILVSEEAITLKLRDQAKTLAKRTGFAQQAASIEDQIRAIDASNASDAKKAAAAAKKAKKAAGDFQVPLILQVAQARAEALGKPTTAILEKIRSAAEKAIKSGRLGLEGQLSAWQTVADVNGQLQDSAKKFATQFQKASTRKIVAGLHLSAADIRRLRARLSQIGVGGTIPTAGFGAFGVPVTPQGDVIQHTTINMDGKKVASSVTRHQQRSRRRNPQQRRGFAGAY